MHWSAASSSRGSAVQKHDKVALWLWGILSQRGYVYNGLFGLTLPQAPVMLNLHETFELFQERFAMISNSWLGIHSAQAYIALKIICQWFGETGRGSLTILIAFSFLVCIHIPTFPVKWFHDIQCEQRDHVLSNEDVEGVRRPFYFAQVFKIFSASTVM